MEKKILIADDSEEIIEILEILLIGEGYEVVSALNGEEAVKLADETIDLIILDVMMPLKSGYVACSEIRQKTMAPILFLTAKSKDSDKLLGFSAGGDDYLVKPFSYSELLGRVKSLLRRYYVYQGKTSPQTEDTVRVGRLSVNLDSHIVMVDEKEVSEIPKLSLIIFYYMVIALASAFFCHIVVLNAFNALTGLLTDQKNYYQTHVLEVVDDFQTYITEQGIKIGDTDAIEDWNFDNWYDILH